MVKSTTQAFFFHDFANSYIPHILKEVYMDRIYHKFLHGKKDLTIVDVGANIGLTAYYFSDFAKTVYALEPSQQHLECLNELKKYNHLDNVTIVPYALSNKDGTTRFYHNQNNTMFSLSTATNGDLDYEEVKTTTLDSLMKRNKIETIDLMKLDVEGFESKLLTDSSFTGSLKKVKLIIGEWHSWTDMNQHQFKNCFEELGFNFKWLNQTEASIFIAELI